MVTSVYVFKAVNRIGSAKLVIAIDSLNISAAVEMQSDVFIPGREIRIDAGCLRWATRHYRYRLCYRNDRR